VVDSHLNKENAGFNKWLKDLSLFSTTGHLFEFRVS